MLIDKFRVAHGVPEMNLIALQFDMASLSGALHCPTVFPTGYVEKIVAKMSHLDMPVTPLPESMGLRVSRCPVRLLQRRQTSRLLASWAPRTPMIVVYDNRFVGGVV